MKTKKIPSFAIMALYITGTLLLAGCPGTISDNPDSKIDYTIAHDGSTVSANGTFSTQRDAKENEPVPITANPNPGYLATNVRVRDSSLNHQVKVERDNTKLNTWTFDMPAHNVIVSMDFQTDSAWFLANTISAQSDWSLINDNNHAISVLQSQGRDATSRINDLRNVITGKMLSEDYRNWISAPSQLARQENATDAHGGSRIHLYTVNNSDFYTSAYEPYPGIIPLPGTGWTASIATTADNPISQGNIFREVVLSYKLGTGTDAPKVDQKLWIVPVAQYQVNWTSGNVWIRLGSYIPASTGTDKTYVSGSGDSIWVSPTTPTDAPYFYTRPIISGIGPNVRTEFALATGTSSVYTIRRGNEVIRDTSNALIQNRTTPSEFNPGSMSYNIEILATPSG